MRQSSLTNRPMDHTAYPGNMYTPFTFILLLFFFFTFLAVFLKFTLNSELSFFLAPWLLIWGPGWFKQNIIVFIWRIRNHILSIMSWSNRSCKIRFNKVRRILSESDRIYHLIIFKDDPLLLILIKDY